MNLKRASLTSLNRQDKKENLVFNISNNSNEIQIIIGKIILDLFGKKKVTRIFCTKINAAKIFFRGPIKREIEILNCAFIKKNIVEYEVAPSQKNRELLIIHRYRCPGAISEIMVALMQLKNNQIMDLIILNKEVNSENIEKTMFSRGYEVSKKINVGNTLYKCTIQAR